MRCLVTGAAGFIGSYLTDYLIAQGFDVVAVDNLSTGKRENVNPRAWFVLADITDMAQIEEHCVECDYLFHLAALPRIQPSFDDPLLHDRVNVHGTLNLLTACREGNLKKFVYSSSSALYGTPTQLPTAEDSAINCPNPYALQKFTAEQYCLILGQHWGIPTIALRYFNVYGPRSYDPNNKFNAYSPVIGIFSHRAAQGEKLLVTGDGQQSRDFVHVADVAAANLAVAQAPQKWEIYNVGAGKSSTINELARRFSQDIEYIPERPGEARDTLADISKIKREIEWQPRVDLGNGLAMMMADNPVSA